MPFKKKEGTEFYQGINLLKSYCKSVIDHIDATPSQILEATDKLMFLSAEKEVDRNLHRLERLIKCTSRMGYRVTDADLADGGEDGINSMAQTMLRTLASKEKKDGI